MPRPRHPTLASWYQEHLASPDWIILRARLLRERGNKCQDCGKIRPLTLHHITYARVTRERDEDLRFLCNKCHRTAHRWHDIPYLFLCYREDFNRDVRDILIRAADEPEFEYPRRRERV